MSNALEKTVDKILNTLGTEIIMGAPLGLGKPVHLINAIYNRAVNDQSINLTIMTALTLEVPGGGNLLENNFIAPFAQRVFKDCPTAQYAIDRKKSCVPKNIKVIEFYYPAGKLLNSDYAQQNYISTNYTHVVRDILGRGCNLMVQMVAKGEFHGKKKLSLSCNPDVTLDLVPAMRKKGKSLAIAVVNEHLPFMHGDAVVEDDFFDEVIESEEFNHTLFGVPKMSVSRADYFIGLYASSLVKDGSALQIGIGALGDSIVHALILRHTKNDLYKEILKDSGAQKRFSPIISKIGDTEKFEEGLFGASEMMVDGFMHLFNNGILKKKVYNDVPIQRLLNEKKINEKFDKDILRHLLSVAAIHSPLREEDVSYLKRFGIFKKDIQFADHCLIATGGVELSLDLADEGNYEMIVELCLGESLKEGQVMHAGFFLGPQDFYESLRNLSEKDRDLINMTSVGGINQLYWSEEMDSLQRKDARFINTGLMATLTGAMVSDGLENGRVVSGVGGQYNFVAMAHAIPEGRSILQLRSTRNSSQGVVSNIVFSYGHITIPRHLRDIIISEYGIADLRGKTDSECIKAMIEIADTRFQEQLMEQAKASGKLEKNYVIPDYAKENLPERIASRLSRFEKEGLFPKFPFGTDFTEDELKIGAALKSLKRKSANKISILSQVAGALFKSPSSDQLELLKRMNLDDPKCKSEWFYQKLLLSEFK